MATFDPVFPDPGNYVDLNAAVTEFAKEAADYQSGLKESVHWDLALRYVSKPRHERLMSTIALAKQLCEKDGSSELFLSMCREYSATDSSSWSTIAASAYKGTYKALAEIPFRNKLVGLWPSVMIDTMTEGLNSPIVFSRHVIAHANKHPNVFLPSVLEPSEFVQYGEELGKMRDYLLKEKDRIDSALAAATEPNVKMGLQLWVEVAILVVMVIQVSYEIYDRERTWRAEQEKKEAEAKRIAEEQKRREEEEDARRFAESNRDNQPIEGSSDFLDRFNENSSTLLA